MERNASQNVLAKHFTASQSFILAEVNDDQMIGVFPLKLKLSLMDVINAQTLLWVPIQLKPIKFYDARG